MGHFLIEYDEELIKSANYKFNYISYYPITCRNKQFPFLLARNLRLSLHNELGYLHLWNDQVSPYLSVFP